MSDALRSPSIQFLRFFAAGVVLLTHTTFYIHERIDRSFSIWHWGEVGVPIFFSISGIVMVVSSSHLPWNTRGAGTFLQRRFVRIVPLYWLATGLKVLITLLSPSVVNHNHFRPDDAVKSFFFIPYFNGDGEVRPMHGVGWTLLHEVFFYLLFGLALSIRARPVILSSAIIVTLWMLGRLWELPSALWVVVTNPINLNFVIGAVAGLAMMAFRDRQLVRIGLGVLFGVAGLLVAFWGELLSPVVLLFVAAILGLGNLGLPRFLRWCEALGDSSYSLYLFHPFVAPAFVLLAATLFSGTPWVIAAITVPATVAVAHLIHLYVERPLIHRLRRTLAA